MAGPLDGLLVVDQTQALAGPYCSMMLGDMGAQVIKVEKPVTGDQSRAWGPPFLGSESSYYLSVNRNKRSITLNIANAEGQAILHRLVARADLFMTNLPSAAALERHRIDYPTLRALNPGLIYLAISGYGLTGPRAGQAGYDLAAQGESGTMFLTGDPAGAPLRFPTPMADMTTGLLALAGILAALYARAHSPSGEGQMIDIGLLESQMTWLANYAGEYFATGQNPPRRGNNHPQVVPYEPMQASDGVWFILGVGSDNTWRKFCGLAGLEQIRDDARFATNSARVINRESLLPIVRAVVAGRSSAEWLELLTAHGIPCGPIRDVAQALADPQVAARNFIVGLEHPALGMVRSLATPLHLSGTPLRYAQHPPLLGEQTEEILQELGLAVDEIAGLRARGVL
jgi:crotonobetainyl-CoA:carnitine CoA-transferase CaiB-like acyl-CoA transferase